MSNIIPDDPFPWRDLPGPRPPEPADPAPDAQPAGCGAPGELIPLPPEPTYEAVESAGALEVIPVVPPICWWCGDPGPLDHRDLCSACQVRAAERDRKREAERARRERDREEEYDYDYESHDERDDDEARWYARESRRARRERDDELDWHGPLQGVMILYVILMLVSLVWGASLLSRAGELTQDDVLRGTAVVEILDTIIILVSLAFVSRKALPDLSPGTRPVAWVVGMPALALLIVLNLLYTSYLRDVFGGGEAKGEISLTLFTVILVCVQPAVIEELYFRYIAFGALYRAAGLHATVWITAMMFAVMHIYNPLGVPYLFLAGVVFGYARVWGGLGLPIVMHFIHNFVVLALEGGR